MQGHTQRGRGGEQVTPLIQFAVLQHRSRERCKWSLFPNEFAACLFASFVDLFCYLGSVLLKVFYSSYCIFCNNIEVFFAHLFFYTFYLVLFFLIVCIYLFNYIHTGRQKKGFHHTSVSLVHMLIATLNLWIFDSLNLCG